MTVSILIDPCIGSGCQNFKATCHVTVAKRQKDKCWNVANFLLFIQSTAMAHRLMSIISLQNSLSFY